MAKKKKETELFPRNKDTKPIQNRVLIATPTRGYCRMEWAAARWGQIIPCNWSAGFANIMGNQTFPIGYRVAEAQNIAVQNAVQCGYEWLLLHEDDVVLPPDAFAKLNVYMREGKVPVVSGLYYLKANPSEPIAYRGRGNSCFDKFKRGDKVWVDGVPTGIILIHCSILRVMYAESEAYQASTGVMVRRVFDTPSDVWRDPETGFFKTACGTSDLFWCNRVMKDKVLKRAGWPEIGKKKYPFLLDTSLFCRHVDFTTGVQYPVGV